MASRRPRRSRSSHGKRKSETPEPTEAQPLPEEVELEIESTTWDVYEDVRGVLEELEAEDEKAPPTASEVRYNPYAWGLAGTPVHPPRTEEREQKPGKAKRSKPEVQPYEYATGPQAEEEEKPRKKARRRRKGRKGEEEGETVDAGADKERAPKRRRTKGPKRPEPEPERAEEATPAEPERPRSGRRAAAEAPKGFVDAQVPEAAVDVLPGPEEKLARPDPAAHFGEGLLPPEHVGRRSEPLPPREAPGPVKIGREPARHWDPEAHRFGEDLVPEDAVASPPPGIKRAPPGPVKIGREPQRVHGPRPAFGAKLLKHIPIEPLPIEPPTHVVALRGEPDVVRSKSRRYAEEYAETEPETPTAAAEYEEEPEEERAEPRELPAPSTVTPEEETARRDKQAKTQDQERQTARRKRRRRKGRPKDGRTEETGAFRDRLAAVEKVIIGSSLRMATDDLRAEVKALEGVAALEDSPATKAAHDCVAQHLQKRLGWLEQHLLTNKAFLDLLDIDGTLAGLELPADDPAAAMTALHHHLVGKDVPAEELLLRDAAGEDLDAADLARQHVHVLRAYGPHYAGHHIAWHIDPVGDGAWPRLLNRHTHWLTLARAWREAKDKQYAQEVAQQLLEWLTANAPDGRADSAVAWETAQIAARACVWPTVFVLLRESKAFSPTVARLLLSGVAVHGEALLERRPEDLSDALAVAAGLVRLGGVFPELAGAHEWLSEGLRRLRALGDQWLDDGGVPSGDPSATAEALAQFDVCAELVRLGGCGELFHAGTSERMHAMCQHVATLLDAQGALPRLGQSPLTQARELVDAVAERWGFDDVRTRLAGETVVEAAGAVRGLPDSGLYSLRMDWRPDADALLFDAAPNHHASAHRDLLQVLVQVDGHPILVDPGQPDFSAATRRAWGAASAHNTITIADAEQPAADAEAVRLDHGNALTLVRASAAAAEEVRHVRKVVQVDRRWWLVVDLLESPSRALFRQSWQFAVEDVIADPTRKSMQGGGLLLLPADPRELRLAIDDGAVSSDFGHSAVRPVARYSLPERERAVFATVLFPLKDAAPADVKLTLGQHLPEGVLGLTLHYPHTRDVVALCLEPAAADLQISGFEAHGEVAAWRVDDSGHGEPLGVIA